MSIYEPKSGSRDPGTILPSEPLPKPLLAAYSPTQRVEDEVGWRAIANELAAVIRGLLLFGPGGPRQRIRAEAALRRYEEAQTCWALPEEAE